MWGVICIIHHDEVEESITTWNLSLTVHCAAGLRLKTEEKGELICKHNGMVPMSLSSDGADIG